MKSVTEQLQTRFSFLLQIHEQINSWTAHLLGPLVFNTGIKEQPWNLSTARLLRFPEGSVGKTLGEFLKKNRLEPIARAESHDLYHVLFDYSISLKDEVALQFFLKGNGKTSIASFGTSFGAWLIFPGQWSYFRSSYKRGKTCRDISTIDLKCILTENFEQVKTSLFEQKTSKAK
ncbi:MAG: Coq4 family protein [Bacteroidota bacterium]